jgi:hypothetical protein
VPTVRTPMQAMTRCRNRFSILVKCLKMCRPCRAWCLSKIETMVGASTLFKAKKEIRLDDGLVLRWQAGQNSALDTSTIAEGADVGNVTAQRDGKDVPYFVDFAFAFHALFPKATIPAKK